MPRRVNSPLLKSPSTVFVVACCMARSWWEPFHSRNDSAWQPLQDSVPVNVSFANVAKDTVINKTVCNTRMQVLSKVILIRVPDSTMASRCSDSLYFAYHGAGYPAGP